MNLSKTTGVNTFAWCTSRSTRCKSTPASVNSQHEHEHNMFIIGRETTMFPQRTGKSCWVLLIEFIETPHQTHIPQEVQVSSETQLQISEEMSEFLSKGAPKALYPSRKRMGVSAYVEPQEAELLCEDRTFRDGRASKLDLKDATLTYFQYKVIIVIFLLHNNRIAKYQYHPSLRMKFLLN